MKEKVSLIYMMLGVVFTTCIVAANILETKIVEVGLFTVTGGLLCFPISYIIGDIVTEVYGYKAMMRIVILGIVMNLVVVILGNIAAALPSPAFWKGEEGFNFVFSFAPRITAASFTAFAIGSYVNSKMMDIMHHRHKERHFCLRAILSTIVGEGADSCVFFPLAFLGQMPIKELVNIIILQIILKTVYEIIVLPLTVWFVGVVKRKEAISDNANEEVKDTAKSNRIALVLADGGAKGYAHIGAIKALEQQGLEIHSVAGTSMGALIGGLYAAGKLDEGYKYLKSINKRKLFSLSDIRHIGIDGLMGGEDVYDVLKEIIGDIRIEDLKVNYCAIATDIDTGEEKVFRKGQLIDAIRASISIPGVFRPYTIRNRRYVDGAMTNGLPINRVHRETGDRVVAINLDTYESSENNSFTQLLKHGGSGIFPSIEGLRKSSHFGFLARIFDVLAGENVFNIITNSFFISINQNKRLMAELTKPDIYINIDLKGYDTHNFNSAEAICKLGYEQVTNAFTNKDNVKKNEDR